MGILGLFVDDSQCGGSLFFSYCRFNAFKSANFIFTILGSNWYHYQCRWDGLMDWKWLLYVLKIIGYIRRHQLKEVIFPIRYGLSYNQTYFAFEVQFFESILIFEKANCFDPKLTFEV